MTLRFPVCVFVLFALSAFAVGVRADGIDRHAVVTRHNPHLTAIDAMSPLSVGNGRFGFTADVTGLQSLSSHYWQNGTPTETQARWSWHTSDNPHNYKLSDANRDYTAHGRTLGYPTQQTSPAGVWLRQNPHIQPLPQISFILAAAPVAAPAAATATVATAATAAGASISRDRAAPSAAASTASAASAAPSAAAAATAAPAVATAAMASAAAPATAAAGAMRALTPADVTAVDQRLDMWSGRLDSRTTMLGHPVTVSSATAPDSDTLALRIKSPLLANKKLAVRIAIPLGYDLPRQRHNPPLDWSHPEAHETKVLQQTAQGLSIEHQRDASRFAMTVTSAAAIRIERTGPHTFDITPAQGDTLDLTIAFAPEVSAEGVAQGSTPTRQSAQIFKAAAAHWQAFWKSGAAIDFTGSTDPRAKELERRVVLSQYLTAIQLGDTIPAQESGLTTNTWFGKHHTEMVWWHTAHFALWGRPAFTARTLSWFQRTLPAARAVAAGRGLKGARWMKMTGPEGRESPGGNPLIAWNQPHPIHLAELMYRADPTRETLERYRELVFETADAMSSMLNWDAAGKRYVLGPPLWIAQEIYDQSSAMNPTYELSYWAWGLEAAQRWRERLGMPRNPEWEDRRKQLSALPQKDGKYVAIESTPDTWDNIDSRHDHPSFLMALGQLPGDGVDPAIMRNTLDAVLAGWDWATKIWGWDYPMVAMTAARLGAGDKAVDVLLKTDGPNNGYTQAGHNPNKGLPVYLPGNGALLAAVALMAGGWDGAPDRPAPGFPADGRWVVRAEGFQRLP